MTPGGKTVRCDNCGNAAGPRFCPHCGQETETRQGPLVEAGREVLSDVLSLDSRLLRSLRALLRPGHLSVLYLRGKRAPFLRPFRLYLVASLVVFSTVLTLATPDVSMKIEIFIAGQLIEPQTSDAILTTSNTSPKTAGPASEAGANVKRTIELLKDDGLFGRWMIHIYGDRVERLKALPREELLEMLFSGLRRALPLTLILFVPFLALGLKLLYIRGKAAHVLYLDHLVFSLHFQSALFFALSTAWVVTHVAGLEILASAITWAAAALVMLFWYLPLALRRFYDQSRSWTAVKTIVVLFVYSRLLGIAVGISVMVATWKA